MRGLGSIAALLLAAILGHCAQVNVCYDSTFDNPANSLTKVACSDGEHGLMTKYGFRTIGDIPSDVASSATVGGWNSETCGACYSLSFQGQKVHVLAIDSKPDGIDLSQKAMETLTNGRALKLGRITADLEQVGLDKCNLISRRKIDFLA